MNNRKKLTRREFVIGGLASTAGLVLVGCGGDEETALTYDAPTQSVAITLEPTPQCDDHDETPAQTEGPFYTPDTPERMSLLEDGFVGTKLVVMGKVLSADCTPIPNAIIDFWHADDAGDYDNEGFAYRGHQFTDANGNYRLETIVPGRYPGRIRHIHVKLQGDNTRLLTTQLYFPDDENHSDDSFFTDVLLLDMVDDGEEMVGVFNFVL